MSAADATAVAFGLDKVRKHYERFTAVDGVELSFFAGRTTALIGSSGSGKSTVLRLLLGLDWPDEGRVLVNGAPLRREHVRELRRRVGYVIQDGGLFPHLTGLENLALQAREVGWARTRIRERADELAELAHLSPDVLDRFPGELSGGQRQRLALMRSLMLDPDALLLDEPLGALDPVVRHDLQDELKAIFERLGKTVILVTHDLAEAAWFTEHLVLMSEGRVVQQGSLDALRHQPASDFVARFVRAQRTLPGDVR